MKGDRKGERERWVVEGGVNTCRRFQLCVCEEEQRRRIENNQKREEEERGEESRVERKRRIYQILLAFRVTVRGLEMILNKECPSLPPLSHLPLLPLLLTSVSSSVQRSCLLLPCWLTKSSSFTTSANCCAAWSRRPRNGFEEVRGDGVLEDADGVCRKWVATSSTHTHLHAHANTHLLFSST